MEHVALDIEAGHLLVTDLDPLRGRSAVSSSHGPVQPVLVVVEAISSTTVDRLVRGLPRQVCVIWQNRRMLDFIPLRGSRRVIGEPEGSGPGFVGQILEFALEQPHAGEPLEDRHHPRLIIDACCRRVALSAQDIQASGGSS